MATNNEEPENETGDQLRIRVYNTAFYFLFYYIAVKVRDLFDKPEMALLVFEN